MRRPGFQIGLLAVLSTLLTLGGLVAAQDGTTAIDPIALAGMLPPCVLNCYIEIIPESACQLTDTQCTCTNAPLQAALQDCVLGNCTIREGLTTRNLTLALCGLPINDRSQQYENIAIAMGVVGVTTVLGRIAFKVFIERNGLGYDDWFALAVVVPHIASTVVSTAVATKNGFGKDIWTLPFESVTRFVLASYILGILYFLLLALIKMSLLFMYLQIFPERAVQRLLWGTIAFNAVFALVIELLFIFQCRPIPYAWLGWDGESEGTCISVNAIGWASGIISVILDIWMLAIPLWQIKKLKMHWKKKAVAGLMFMVGTFITVVSIIRLNTLFGFSLSSNPTLDSFNVGVWSTIEISVGIICTCMPTLRKIIIWLFPSIFGGSRSAPASRKSPYYNSSGNTGNSNNDGSRNRDPYAHMHKPSVADFDTTGAWNDPRRGGGVRVSDDSEIGLGRAVTTDRFVGEDSRGSMGTFIITDDAWRATDQAAMRLQELHHGREYGRHFDGGQTGLSSNPPYTNQPYTNPPYRY
ncbi:hypothetical protein B0T17DRAFT_642347 [Bombardia bombarda]|uniref:CFEM domain-containing protein n=1 Tax=Bombardia bombarda TaxID=252184 RepID=A0AA39WUT9_9PEZI|nr:hypothetical protein B0T17DRAFT_642347 [Bombardia bombarda]